jgi:hypothetical protein
MTKKEKRVQAALGTRKSPQIVAWEPGQDPTYELKEALKNFGVYVYKDSALEDMGVYSYVFSDKKLTPDEVEKIAEEFWGVDEGGPGGLVKEEE